jgi:hypothetical protein
MKKKSQTQASVKAKRNKESGDSKMQAVLERSEAYSIEESNHPSHLRRGAVTISEIRELASVLIDKAQTLNGIATQMEKLAIKSCDRVDGVTKGTRGKKLVAEFAANLNRAFKSQWVGSVFPMLLQLLTFCATYVLLCESCCILNF